MTDDPRRPETPGPVECDIVMKGGITSGIIYPPLVLKLHDHGYSFRNVGGTSAGAIAAAVTAAAEFGKDRRDAAGRGGFEKLREVREWLSTGANLRNLFQADRDTAPLMNTLLGYSQTRRLRWPPLRVVAALVRNDPLAFVLGALLGVVVAALFSVLVTGRPEGVFRGGGLVVLALFALAGGLLGGAWHLYEILKHDVPKNGYGLCSGRRRESKKHADAAVLTDWLHAKINDLAGEGPAPSDAPLTFGRLWRPRSEAQAKRREKGIDLRMMTSNLSQNQPYVLPFDRDLFIFDAGELRRLFPQGVVRHMVRRARRPVGVRLPPDCHFLPGPADLPVIFATRLSLSFPVLISMVPLYTISQKAFHNRVRCEVKDPPPAPAGPVDAGAAAAADDGVENDVEIVQFSHEVAERHWEDLTDEAPRRVGRDDLQRNWFSDGGICSNFPIHFFDSWLPRRPTFGVNLTSQLARGVPEEQGRASGAQVAGAGPAAEGSKLAEKRTELVKERSAVPVVCDEFESGGTGTRVQSHRGYGEDVYLPLPNEIIPPEWIPIDGLGKFLETVFRTAQNYRDNMQAMLPSYRERIVQIRLTDHEGGINLDMDEETIKGVVRKGEDAGAKLCDKFVLEHHQWVRFRVLLKQMESQLVELHRVIGGSSIYKNIMDTDHKFDTKDYPYVPEGERWLSDIVTRLDAIGQVIKAFEPNDLFATDPRPQPDPVLRVTPQI